ncbi:MAG: MBL fold metallo-hydrolase [Deltaproteobacteria bacterium]|nr:MBL fold metallo-hydrolase [Deltaproteobacteria bacterium]
MALEIEFLGWATFRLISDKGTKMVIDPSLEGDLAHKVPRGTVSVKDLADTHMVIVTHAAPDHFAQTVELMKTSRATLFCSKDVSLKVLKEGIPAERVFSMVPGVRFTFMDIGIKALKSAHISMSEFEGHWLTGVPLSFLLDFGPEERIFYSGDDALGPHYRFYGEFYQPNLAFLGIGGINTNGQCLTELYPDEAAVAAKWLNVRAVIPMHYLGDEDQKLAQELAKTAPEVQLAVMQPGERLRFSGARGIIPSNL